MTRRQAQERGLTVYFTGKPCPHGHVSDRRTHNGECVVCAKEKRKPAVGDVREAARLRAAAYYAAKQAPARAARAERVAGWIAAARVSRPDLEIVTRDAALAAGLSAYFIGQPCPKGHVAERSIKNRCCLECRRAANSEWKAANAERVRDHNARWHSENAGEARAKNHRRRARLLSAEGTHTAEDIAAIRKAQKDRCAYCRARLKGRGEIDHIHPLKPRKGLPGRNDRTNLQLTCRPCNASKKDQHPVEFAQKRGLLL